MAAVNIITSVYNKGPWLERCLKSFVNQTFTDIEVIVINNGSTDNCAEIIKKYMNLDKRIKLIELDENIGPAGGYAIGIDLVTADYFTICDADDYIDVNYVEILYNEIKKVDADIVMCTNDYIWKDGRKEINKRPEDHRIVFECNEVNKLLPQLLDHESSKYLGYYLAEVGAVWAKLYKTDFVRKLGINYEKDIYLWCDWLFNFRLLKKAHKFVYTDATVYHNYMSENSVTRPVNINRNRISEIEYTLGRFEEECLEIVDSDLRLYEAKMQFYLNNILGLRGYYKRFYKRALSMNEVLTYLRKICDLEVFQEVFEHKDDIEMSFKNKIILVLLKNQIYLGDIIKLKFNDIRRNMRALLIRRMRT